MTTTVIYCRISKDREGRELGVERQEAACRELAERLGLTVDRVFVDNDISASTLSKKRRPEYEEMMAEAEAGQVAMILAYSNSRLTRRRLEFERLVTAHTQTGVRFRTVVSGDDDLSTADGQMIASIKASIDQAESQRISERVRAQKAQAREQGLYPGGWRSFGLEADGVTVRESEAVERVAMSQAVLDGTSILALCRDLNARGVPTSTGGKWGPRGMRRVLMRPHPAVDADVHEAVLALVEDPARKTTPGPGRVWLLSGLAHCGVCGATMVGSGSSKGAGLGTYPAYRCKSGKHVVVSALTLDEFVSEIVIERMSRPDARFAKRTTGAVEAGTRAKVLRTRLDALADNLEIDERTLARRSRALQAELDALEQQVAAAARTTALGAFAGRDPATVWAGLALDQRRTVVDILMDIVVVRTRSGVVPRDRRWRDDLPAFDPDRVLIVWKSI